MESVKWVIGVDEVGRGPLAGPVSVGVCAVPVSLNEWSEWGGLRDSKKLSEKKREEWYMRIVEDGRVKWAVAHSTAVVIDSEGIVSAIKRAAAEASALLELDTVEAQLLADRGIVVPGEWSQEQFTKGDETIPVIALASIMAKVARDRMMVELGAEYPAYGFEKHKGYGTKSHQEAIVAHGLLADVHRASFCKGLVGGK